MLDTLGERFRGSVMMKPLIVFGLVLVLQVPVHRIENLVGEREGHRAIAESEVQRSWGGVQCVEGPLLVIPYKDPSHWIRPEGQTTLRFVVLGPETLEVLASLVRTRGMFDVLLYSAEVSVGGSFFPPGESHSPFLPSASLASLCVLSVRRVSVAPSFRDCASALRFHLRRVESSPRRSRSARDSWTCGPGPSRDT